MTQAITSFAVQPAARKTRASDVVAPLGDALWANIQLHVKDWLPSKVNYSNRLDDAQLGKGTFSGRAPMRRLGGTSPILRPEEVQRQIVESGLTSDDVNAPEGTRAETLKIKIDDALERRRLEGIVGRADRGLGTQLLLGATGLAVDFADPVNLATMAIPGVGEVKAAALLTKMTARLGPTISKYVVRAGVGAYEGAVSSAMLEPIDYAVDQRLGNDHDLLDTAWNIGLGALGGSVLHVGSGAGVDLYHSIRLRRAFSVDDCCATMDDVLRQFGQGHNVEVALSVAAQDARVLPNAKSAQADALVAPADSETFPSNSILAIPSQDIGGTRVELGHLFSVKDWLREYEPVASLATGPTSSTGSAYRVLVGDDVIAVTQQFGHSGDHEVFTVQRLNPDHPDFGAPLSERRADADVRSWEADERILFVRPPIDLKKRFADGLGPRMDRVERMKGLQLMRYRPPEVQGGHSVGAEVGMTAHNILNKHTDVNGELRRVKMLNGKKPDSAHILGKDVELKPDTKSGRAQGKEQALDYQRTRQREAVVLLYEVPQAGIDTVNANIVKAWDTYIPGWQGMDKADRKAAWEKVRLSMHQGLRKRKSRARVQNVNLEADGSGADQ